jgi:hypothetical protein
MLRGLREAELAVVLLGAPVAFTGGVFKFLAVQDPHRTAVVFDEPQQTSCQAHAGPGCP